MITVYEDRYKEAYSRLVKLLWDDCLDQEIDEIIQDHNLNKGKIFLYLVEDEVAGFCNTSIRNDYVEGCSSNGVGYIEGIYVCEPYRRNQIAYKLINHVKAYFKALGLDEIGSDTDLTNEMSQIFHKAVGFKEVSKNVHYIMKIGD